MRQVIGSDELLKATNQNDVDGLDYQLRTDDDLLIAGEFQIKNLKMNKVKVIERENGNFKKAEDMQKHCEEVGWTAISMKNDFVTIYGDDVKYIK